MLLFLIRRENLKKKMIIELSFALVGGAHLGLEKSWKFIESIMKKYPDAKWKKVVDYEHKKGKYIVEIF